MSSARAKQRIKNFSRRFNPNEPKTSAAAVAKIQDQSDPSSSSASNGASSTLGNNNSQTSSSISSTSPYNLRAPALHRKHSAIMSLTKDFVLPDLPWLCGTWHVTHSTLPMWRDKRNVRIRYTRLAGNKLDDLVTYQALNSREVSSVHGVDSPKRDGRYVWRGKGLLMVASSKWEVLGWGGGGPSGDEEWVVTYFNKTMFTPAGIDIYARTQRGLTPATVSKLRKGLAGVEKQLGKEKEQGIRDIEGDFSKLVGQLFAVKRDGMRTDEVLVE